MVRASLAGKSLTDALFPDPHTWEPEVHLNAKCQIRADHDDPNGMCVFVCVRTQCRRIRP